MGKCLTCDHAKFIAPSNWKPEWKGETYERTDADDAISRTGLAQKLECTLNPVWLEFNTDHYCGQWTCGDLKTRFIEEEHRFLTWRQNTNDYAKNNAELKRQLKKAREISASRLSRLTKNGESHDL